jgi:prolyl-tRNA synthetase
MTHSDDDGLVLPPRLAPRQLVILPIYKNDEDRSRILEYCDRLQKELEAQQYAGEAVRVAIDDRDIRGGEKKWHYVKRGVPLRAEVGPRDLESDSVFLGRRDTGESEGVGREQLVGGISGLLEEIQSNLFDRALELRESNSSQIDNLDDFTSFFTPPDGEKASIHGGFAWSYFNEDPKTTEVLNRLKVTVRCIPLDDSGQQGTCLFTGRPSTQRAVFARAY